MPKRTKNNPGILTDIQTSYLTQNSQQSTGFLACSPIAATAERSETGDIIHRAEDLLINDASSDFPLPDSDDNDAISKCVTSTDCDVQLKLLLNPSGLRYAVW
jgi:hypothetical protein